MIMENPRFEPRFGGPPSQMVITTPPTKGTLHARVGGLIAAIQGELRNFDEGRTVYCGHLIPIKNSVQHCLLDIGSLAQEELREIVDLNLGPSEGLYEYYRKGIFNAFEAPGDTEFVRLQQEYDKETPPKMRRMIELLAQVARKIMDSVLSAPLARPEESRVPRSRSRGSGDPRKPYSDRDRQLYELIGSSNLSTFTNAELWKRYRWKCRNVVDLVDMSENKAAFRNSLHRIRVHHGIPAPSQKKLAQP